VDLLEIKNDFKKIKTCCTCRDKSSENDKNKAGFPSNLEVSIICD